MEGQHSYDVVRQMAESTTTTRPNGNAPKKPPPKVTMPTEVVCWLEHNFEEKPDSSITKDSLYEAYENFCRAKRIKIDAPNVFAKIVYRVFKNVKASRFGGPRRQVTHYAGLGLRRRHPDPSPPSSPNASSTHSPSLPSLSQHSTITPHGSPSRKRDRDPPTLSKPGAPVLQLPPIPRPHFQPILPSPGISGLPHFAPPPTVTFTPVLPRPLQLSQPLPPQHLQPQPESAKATPTATEPKHHEQTTTTQEPLKPNRQFKRRRIEINKEEKEKGKEKEKEKGREGEEMEEKQINSYSYQTVTTTTMRFSKQRKEAFYADNNEVVECAAPEEGEPSPGTCFSPSYWDLDERDYRKIDWEINQIMTNRLSAYIMEIYGNLWGEQDLFHAFQIKKYAQTFAETHWPFLPLKDSVFKGSILDSFATAGDNERSVLTLNLCCAVHAGALMARDFGVARDVYDMCRYLITTLRDVKDINMAVPLMILSHNSFSFADPKDALTIATDYVKLGMSICEDIGQTETEIYLKCQNLQVYICEGRLPPLTTKRFPPSIVFEDPASQRAYQLTGEVLQFSAYLQHALHQFKSRKSAISQYSPEEQKREYQELADSLIKLKKNAKMAIATIAGISELSMNIIKISLYPRVLELFWELGKRTKALKYAAMQLKLIREVGMATFCVSCQILPEVFLEMQRLDMLTELVELLDGFRFLRDVAQFHAYCKGLLEGALRVREMNTEE